MPVPGITRVCVRQQHFNLAACISINHSFSEHIGCRFQACLKSAGNSIASMIGYIYFNYVGTTCFNLKPVKTCQKRSWWGACSSYSTEYTAQVRESSLNF